MLSQEGLWAAWNICAKATLGAGTTILLTATTPTIEILRGLERLRVPGVVVAIANFMVRYLEVIAGEMRRMKIARDSRGFEGRWLWQARAVAAGAGTLFIRSYERGERVYLAMVSRGYAGSLPGTSDQTASSAEWTAALAVPLFAALVSAGAWVMT
jgi:cobalt/nickel transport system permease protein